MAVNITIARLNTMVTANAVQFVSEFNKAENVARRTASSIKNVLSSLGAGFSIAGVGLFAKSVIDLGSHIVDLSAQAGMSTKSFQTLANVAAESGVNMEMVAKAAESMRAKIQEAADGSESARKSLHALNLTAAGLQALKPEEQWEVIAKRIAAATDRQAALNAASDLFGGKIGPKLKEVLDRLAKDGYDKLAASTSKLMLTDAQLKSLDDAGDKLTRIATQMKVIAAQKFLEVANSRIMDLVAMVISGPNSATGLKSMVDFISKNRAASIHGDREITNIRSLPPEQSIEQKMKAGQNTSPWDSMREENAQKKAVTSLLDEFFGEMDAKSKTYRRAELDFKIPEVNTDRLSKIGLLTGDKSQEEVKKQTGFLQDLVNEAKRTNALLSRGSVATFA